MLGTADCMFKSLFQIFFNRNDKSKRFGNDSLVKFNMRSKDGKYTLDTKEKLEKVSKRDKELIHMKKIEEFSESPRVVGLYDKRKS